MKKKEKNILNFQTNLIFSFPWNQNTLIGFSAELTMDMLMGGAYFFVNSVVLMLFISICLHHDAFNKMFRHSLHELDQSNQDRARERDNEERLRQLIDFRYITQK